MAEKEIAADVITFYTSIGQAISAWTGMETALILIAALLLEASSDKTGVVFYSIQNFHLWLNILDELFGFDQDYAKHRRKWTPITSDLRAMNDTRVRLAHHTRDRKASAPALIPATLDLRSKSKKYKPLTTSEVVDFSENITAVTDKLTGLLVAMYETRRALLGIPLRREDGLPEAGAR